MDKNITARSLTPELLGHNNYIFVEKENRVNKKLRLQPEIFHKKKKLKTNNSLIYKNKEK